MTFVAALLAFLDELVKGLNLWQTGAQRQQDRQAGADALAASTSAETTGIADAQDRNDVAPRSLDAIAQRLRDESLPSGSDGRTGGAVRPSDKLDQGAKG
jgi:hypothetical protein